LVGLEAKTEADDKEKQYNPNGQSNEEGFQFLEPFCFRIDFLLIYPTLNFYNIVFLKCNEFLKKKFARIKDGLPSGENVLVRSGWDDFSFVIGVSKSSGLNRDGHLHQEGEDKEPCCPDAKGDDEF